MKRLKRLRRLAIAYVMVCGLLWLGQERLLFWPSATIKRTPEAHDLAYEDVWLPVPSADGTSERLHGWWIPATHPDAPVLLYLHHNAVNVSANLSQAEDFQELGCTVLLIDYRGFGHSEGKFPTESRVYQDAEATWDYLIQKRGIAANRIVIYGHSLGSAIALNLAANHPEAAAAIVQNPFTSMRDMSKRFGIFWLFPVDLLLRQKFNSIGKVRQLQMPILFIHGMRDPQIPYTMSQTLFAVAPEPKQLLLIPDQGHDNNMQDRDLAVVGRFLQTVLGNSASDPGTWKP